MSQAIWVNVTAASYRLNLSLQFYRPDSTQGVPAINISCQEFALPFNKTCDKIRSVQRRNTHTVYRSRCCRYAWKPVTGPTAGLAPCVSPTSAMTSAMCGNTTTSGANSTSSSANSYIPVASCCLYDFRGFAYMLLLILAALLLLSNNFIFVIISVPGTGP